MSNVQETASKFIYPAEIINLSPAKCQQKLSSAANWCGASAIRLKHNSEILIKKPEQIKAHGSHSPSYPGYCDTILLISAPAYLVL